MTEPNRPPTIHKSQHQDPDTSLLLDMVGRAEGAGYDTVFGYNERRFGWKPTTMTLNEVFKNQKLLARSTGSSAFGKYQIIEKTLRRAVAALDIPRDSKFTPEVQDRIALWLLEKRGYDKFRSGKMSKEEFLKNLSKEWASIPVTVGGNSFYAGDSMNNKASKAGNELAKHLIG